MGQVLYGIAMVIDLATNVMAAARLSSDIKIFAPIVTVIIDFTRLAPVVTVKVR